MTNEITFPGTDAQRNGRPVAFLDGDIRNDWIKTIFLEEGRKKLVWNNYYQRFDLMAVLGNSTAYAKISEYNLGKELSDFLQVNKPFCYVQDKASDKIQRYHVTYIFPEKR